MSAATAWAGFWVQAALEPVAKPFKNFASKVAAKWKGSSLFMKFLIVNWLFPWIPFLGWLAYLFEDDVSAWMLSQEGGDEVIHSVVQVCQDLQSCWQIVSSLFA